MKTSPLLAAALAFATGLSPLCAAPSVAEMTVPELKKSATQGNVEAELVLGYAYEYGQKGVTANPQEALVWYKKAAAQGDGNAMQRIGHFYETGTVVERNIEEAIVWYKKAGHSAKQTFAESDLLRLSKAGLMKEKLAGLTVEGGLLLSELDTTTPLDQLVADLAQHTKLRETGKGYWIGYNEHMYSIANRGDDAIPLLVAFAKVSKDPKARYAATLTLHLIGVESVVTGRFSEVFKNRKAREALWELLAVEGLTDQAAMLLKRDPWPADLPAYIHAFQAVTDCPFALNALDRYPIPDRPMDTLEGFGNDAEVIKFTIPKKYTTADYARLALAGIEKEFPGEIIIEDGLFEELAERDRGSWSGNSAPIEASIKLGDLLVDRLKDLSPTFDFCHEGKALYYYGQFEPNEVRGTSRLCFCTARTAKKRWVDWWKQDGEKRYSARLGE